MNVEIVAQMFKNYQSNVLFNLEGKSGHCTCVWRWANVIMMICVATNNLKDPV